MHFCLRTISAATAQLLVSAVHEIQGSAPDQLAGQLSPERTGEGNSGSDTWRDCVGGGNLGCGRRGRKRGEGADGDQIVNEGIGSGGPLIHPTFDSD